MKSIVLASSLLLAGCSASLQDYDGTDPKFDLQSYFTGDVTAWGMIQDYSGKMTRRFCVDIVGTWEDNKGQLHETFYYDDGEQQIRIWELNTQPDGTVTGTAGDVNGMASGAQNGASFYWKYSLQVPIGDSVYNFTIDDWMYMMDENRVMNRSDMSKFGVGLAEITIFFDKTPPVRSCKS